MHDQKLIKKIFNLAWYDFGNNFNNLLSITGLHAIIISVLFCALCFVTSNYQVSLWGWTPNIIFDWFTKLYVLAMSGMPSWQLGTIGLILMASLIILPLIIIQNCLDLAFDCTMRGFSIAGLVFSYVGAMILGHGILLLFMQFMSGVAIFSILYFMQTTVIMHLFVIRFIMFMIAALILYFMQLTYFLSMHILEYKQNIWQSCKEVYQMISDKFLFLSKILFLQILISISVLSFFYIGLSRVVTFFAGVIAWPFNLFAIDLSLIFIYMVHNFFYAWAYLLLYAWVCLVWAHVYRQLNCPPTENPSCASCKSCEI